MPIKFRCKHCRQFLGISRTQAGHLVDCPACGLTIRVPRLDGKVEPVPEPELNLADEKLAGALNQLANIGQATRSAAATGGGEESVSDSPQIIEPALSPEPIIVEAPLPAEPIALEPIAPSVATAADVPAVDPDEAMSQVAKVPASATTALAAGQPESARWRVLLKLPAIIAIGVGVAAGFSAGMIAGRGTAKGEPAEATPDREQTRPADPPPVPPGRKVALTGQITYRTRDGRSPTDAGARILVLPEQRGSSTARLNTDGLRPNDTEEDFAIALAGLRAMGGDAATADAEGKFQISLPQAGKYHVVVLSHYQARDTEQSPGKSLIAALGSGVADPNQLIGSLACTHTRITFDGEKPETFNHTFDIPPAG